MTRAKCKTHTKDGNGGVMRTVVVTVVVVMVVKLNKSTQRAAATQRTYNTQTQTPLFDDTGDMCM